MNTNIGYYNLRGSQFLFLFLNALFMILLNFEISG
jgi:hypothetical protein